MSVEISERKGSRSGTSNSGHNTAVHASHAFQVSQAVQPSSLSASQGLSAVHADHAVHESSAKSVCSLHEAVKAALSMGIGENCCWNYARAIKAFERTSGKLPRKELESVFSLWWGIAKSQLPKDADYHEYLGDFLCCYENANVPLGQNALKNAITAAQSDVRQCDIENFGEKAAKLLALCRQLQHITKDKPFYFGQRDAGAVMGTADPYAPKKAITLLVSRKVLTIVKMGTYKERQATCYRLNSQFAIAVEQPRESHIEPAFE